jgi:putative DNA primase/helicase
MSLHDAMRDACRAVGIVPPRSVTVGRWVKTQVDGKERSNTSGRVRISPDNRSGVAWNWTTGQHVTFRDDDVSKAASARPARDLEAERRQEAERREIEATCERIVRTCEVATHPYLARKGFADERGLVIADVWRCLPQGDLGKRLASALPEGEGPLLVVPGRIGQRITTVQFITPDGAKKNILGGLMNGAAHRIATGAETWVCEGIATALSVRAALRLLGRSATVLSAFAASNVCKVAQGLPKAIVAADHDRSLEQFNGQGTGEYYALRSGRVWAMPPELGDWNDYHQAHGLRAVAMALRGVRPP